MVFESLARTPLATSPFSSALSRSLLLAVCLNMALSASAHAQERKVTISRDKLPPVTWFNAPLDIQIVNENPRVKNLINTVNAPTYEINLPPLPQGQGNVSPYRNLSPVNLNGSNINRSQATSRNLPPAARPIYAMNDAAAPGRSATPAPSPNRPRAMSAPAHKPGNTFTPASTYADTRSSSAPIFSTSPSTFSQVTKSEVRANLLKKTN